MAAVHSAHASDLVRCKLDEFFWEWLAQPETQKIVRQAVQNAKTDCFPTGGGSTLSPHFSSFRGSPTGRPSPPGSPHRTGGFLRESIASSDISSLSGFGSDSTISATAPPSSPKQRSAASHTVGAYQEARPPAAVTPPAERLTAAAAAAALSPGASDRSGLEPGAEASKVIPKFWTPRLKCPAPLLSAETREAIHQSFVDQGITDGIKTHAQLEPIVTEVFRLSKYFVVPIFHKIKVFHDIIDSSVKSKQALLAPSPEPITEQMLVEWAQGRVQPDDLVLSFFYVVKKDHNDWIERDDFNIFISAILITHPGLDFLQATAEFQDRYADTVVSRIFFVYDCKDVGRIYLFSLRRCKPSVIETWQQLADNDDIKMVRDYFSYEHFYVIYCTFWELDSDHDMLLDKDDLLKYDGHALSRRTVDRIFSEVVSKFTSTVPGKMGYEDFIRFLLCDQDRQTDRSMDYWFAMFDLDGDGCIRDHEMKYFYEEQVQRMECLNYDTIPFADIMCQMNDMISPSTEGVFRPIDFKRGRKFAGTFFSLFSSLNKFLAFEHRDPFAARQEQLDNPSLSDWDRWCADEYLRLASEEPDEDGGRGSGDEHSPDDGFGLADGLGDH